MSEQRTYQGHVYTREAPGQPWTLAGAASAGSPALPSGGMIIRDPTVARTQQRQDNADTRAAEGLQMERERLRMSQAAQAQEAQMRALQIQKAQGELNPEGGAGGLDAATKTYYAQQVLAGAPMPAIGMGKQAAANRQAIMEEVARLGGAQGLTGADAAAQIAHYKAGTKQIANLENMAGTIGVNEQTALANGQQFIDRSAELPFQTSIAPLNSISNALQRMFGGTTIAKADAAYNTFVNEYAKVVAGSPSGAGVLSDSARHEAMSTISGSGSVAQKQAAFAQMKADMANRMVAIHGGINEAYKALTRQPGYQIPGTTAGLTAKMDGHDEAAGMVAGATGAGGGGSDGGGFGARFSPADKPSGGLGLATGATTTERDPKANALIDSMIRRGATPDEINKQLANVGQGAVNPADIAAAQAYLRKNPAYKGSFADAIREVPTSGLNQFSASALGAGITAASDAVNPFNGDLSGNRDEFRLKRGLLRSANPVASLLGDLTGGTLAAVGLEAGAGAAAGKMGLKLTKEVGDKVVPTLASKLIPRAGDAIYGAAAGAGNAEDGQRVAGALLGGTVAPIAGLVGSQIAKPIAAGVRAIPGASSAGQAINNALGRAANIGGNAIRGARGEAPVAFTPAVAEAAPAALSGAQQAIAKALATAGPDDVLARLGQAGDIGVPMALADAHPALTSLAGAAVRRSPNADAIAQNALLPRSRGQIDRFGAAISRDLGPVENIPQLSADMTAQARAAAEPLYKRAYANPVDSTPELSATLGTPFGRQALGRANTIAANERRAPSELGFAQDAEGNVILNPQPNQAMAAHLGARAELDAAQEAYRAARTGSGDVTAARNRVELARENMRSAEQTLAGSPDPSQAASVPGYTTQTLDYVKRGMDDVLEQYRNPITGRLVLDEAGRAQNQVKNQFLGEVDRLNPAYADARNAYAGPVQARDAMTRGQDALTMNPNELGMQVSNQSPEHLAQMQLGYRSALMDRANSVRFSSNPFDATLGSPAAEQRLSTLYPDTPSVATLLSQRDMERQLAGSTNEILGNSRTAQRQIADQAFETNPLMEAAMHGGAAMATHGASLPGTAARVAGIGLKDAFTMGMGKRAVARADEMAPVLFNTDPSAASDSIAAILNAAQARREYLMRVNQAASARGGVLGAAGGSSVAAALAAGQ